ncbi:MAG: hypothetical protein Q8P84_00690, partial [Deltaproteobacteria bacterium]|nr:hypothetical protein [Deltaproteobacteria bacterium]
RSSKVILALSVFFACSIVLNIYCYSVHIGGNAMNDNVRAGDMILKAGDGGSGGRGGDMTVGPGTYKAGDAVINKTQLTVGEFVNFLEPVILANPNLPEPKKKSLVEQLKSGAQTIKSLADLAVLLSKVFGG